MLASLKASDILFKTTASKLVSKVAVLSDLCTVYKIFSPTPYVYLPQGNVVKVPIIEGKPKLFPERLDILQGINTRGKNEKHRYCWTGFFIGFAELHRLVFNVLVAKLLLHKIAVIKTIKVLPQSR